MLIIDSIALNQNFNTKIHTPKDTDFICTQEEFDACYDELKSENSIKELKDLSSHHKAIFLEDGSILEFIIANGDTNQTLLDKQEIRKIIKEQDENEFNDKTSLTKTASPLKLILTTVREFGIFLNVVG